MIACYFFSIKYLTDLLRKFEGKDYYTLKNIRFFHLLTHPLFPSLMYV